MSERQRQKMAYCIQCLDRLGLSKFAFIDPTHIDKGDTVFYLGGGKELRPSRVGVCLYCNAKNPQLLEGMTA